MENKTSFDLAASIRRWRESLAQTRAFKIDDLDELETHLRDSITELEAKGLSSEEALIIAARRVGPPQDLAAEFARSGAHGQWIDRIGWMIIGWGCVAHIQASISSYTLLWLFQNLRRPSALQVVFLGTIFILPLVMVVLIGMFLIRTNHRGRPLAILEQSPLRLSFVVFLALLLPHVFRTIMMNYVLGIGGWPFVIGNLMMGGGGVLFSADWIIIPMMMLIFTYRFRKTRRALA